jgi:acyl carrier protein
MDSTMQAAINKRAEVITLMKEELIKRLNLPYKPEDLHEDISLFGAGLGLDSLDALEVVLCIEHCFDIKVPEHDVSIMRSINTLADYVLEQKEEKEADDAQTSAA